MSSLFSYLLGSNSAPQPAAEIQNTNEWQFVAESANADDQDTSDDEFVLVAVDKVKEAQDTTKRSVVVPENALVLKMTTQDPVFDAPSSSTTTTTTPQPQQINPQKQIPPTTTPPQTQTATTTPPPPPQAQTQDRPATPPPSQPAKVDVVDEESIAWANRQFQTTPIPPQFGLQVIGTWGTFINTPSSKQIVIPNNQHTDEDHHLLLLRKQSPQTRSEVIASVGVTVTFAGGVSIPGVLLGSQCISANTPKTTISASVGKTVVVSLGSKMVFGEKSSTCAAKWGGVVDGVSMGKQVVVGGGKTVDGPRGHVAEGVHKGSNVVVKK